jgi:catechol 2,3-dioxygenase-like lactoylglutathione lyase family enzyme
MKVTLIAAVFVAGMFTGGVWTKAQKPSPADLPAQRVTGIGGVFFKAKDPKTLSAWYRDALGIALQAGGAFSLFEWREREDSSRLAHTVWSLFPSGTKYFAPSDAAFMVNYRVRDLDRMLAQLRALGVRIEPKVMEDFNGKFAWIVDPEGNKIELWEPKAGY